jgi:hypothetical protein
MRLQHLGQWYQIDVYDHHKDGEYLLALESPDGLCNLNGPEDAPGATARQVNELRNWCEQAVAERLRQIAALPEVQRPAARCRRVIAGAVIV